MPVYEGPIVGTGTERDPIRPLFDGDARIGWINLAPPGSPTGRCVLYLPEPSADPRLTKIAELPGERMTTTIRTAWENTLGITLQRESTASFADLLAEILMDHGREDGSRWRGIRAFPSVARLQHEVYLGALGLVWSQAIDPVPHSKSYQETWPTDSTTLSSGQDQAWTETDGNLEVSGGVLRAVDAVTLPNAAKCDSALDTASQRHTASFTLVDGVTVINIVRTGVRFTNANNGYFASAIRRSTTGHSRQGLKRVTGTQTVIVTGDTNDPGASGTIMASMDGSTMSVTIGSLSASGTDASPALTGNLNGGVATWALGGIGQATLDNHTIADVTYGGPLIGARLIHGDLVGGRLVS